MFGVHSGQKREREKSVDENIDVARLFFDAFSKRVGTVEDGLKTMSSEIERLKTVSYTHLTLPTICSV